MTHITVQLIADFLSLIERVWILMRTVCCHTVRPVATTLVVSFHNILDSRHDQQRIAHDHLQRKDSGRSVQILASVVNQLDYNAFCF